MNKPWWMKSYLMDTAGDGTGSGGGSGGGDGTKTQDLTEIVKSVGMLTQVVAGLASGMKDMQTSLTSMPDTFRELLPKGRTEDNDDDSRRTGDDFSNVDLESLDRRQFATLLLSQFSSHLEKALDEKLRPFDEKINNVRETVARDLGTRQFHDVNKEHPDLMEWKDEIQSILKTNPGLSLKHAYTIARSDNLEKAKTIDAKYKKDDSGKDGAKQLFFGLTPTSTNEAPSEKSGRRMDFKQAAEKALEDVMASIGGGSIDSVARISG